MVIDIPIQAINSDHLVVVLLHCEANRAGDTE